LDQSFGTGDVSILAGEDPFDLVQSSGLSGSGLALLIHFERGFGFF